MATKSRGVRLMFKVQVNVHDLKWKDSAVSSADRTSTTPSLQLRVNIALFEKKLITVSCSKNLGPVLCRHSIVTIRAYTIGGCKQFVLLLA